MHYNNLTVGNGYMAYAHRNEICLFVDPGPVRLNETMSSLLSSWL